MYSLKFDPSDYSVETVEIEGMTITFRAFKDRMYVANPVDEKREKLSIYVPEAYYAGEMINGYDLKTAPIFFPNGIGGYRPTFIEYPGKAFWGNTVNILFYALQHGCVVVSPGARGINLVDENGKYYGTAPAGLVDLKAAVRYLRYNKELIPGNVDRIISNGTSAGGAMSALLGTTGNHPDYASYFEALGAAPAQDHIFASSCYCPITNLDHADMAYEWEFCGINDYHRMKFKMPEGGPDSGLPPIMTPVDEVMTPEQIEMSKALKPMFPAYLNSLNLKDQSGSPLTLDAEGNGSFKDYVLEVAKASVERAMQEGVDMTEYDWMTIEDGKVVSVDFDKFVNFRTRMKETPAFDNVRMGTPENEVFGNAETLYRHFTQFSFEHSAVGGALADAQTVKMYNPMYYIHDEKAVKAKHFRIRHGLVDRDTSLAISAILTTTLENAGIDADLAYPWGRPHSGDYDPDELFAWIDKIVKNV